MASALWYLLSLTGQIWTGLAPAVTLEALFEGGGVSLTPVRALSRGWGLQPQDEGRLL